VTTGRAPRTAPERAKPPASFDDNPAWTAADFAAATVGPHWSPLRAAEALRAAARDLRAQADRMEAEADALVGAGSAS
jgi:hypothetical protein